MSKFNILYKICGSIAAYKSAYLISKLVQNDFDVRVVVTPSTINFIGEATLEGLTGKSVYCDSFKKGQMMSHIDLVKWADLSIIAPATGNTINKLANGISDNLLTSLFLAHDWTKPYLIAPAMNTKMFEHPATIESIKKLTNWGVKILHTDTGFLACGDEGDGKLLDPDKIFEFIQSEIAHLKNVTKGNIIITSGGTTEDIDNVRSLRNISSGRTGAIIAEKFIRNNYGVTYLCSSDAIKPTGSYNSEKFRSFKDLENKLKFLLNNNWYDAIIHLAAVSDYTPTNIFINDDKHRLPLKDKISSQNNKITIELSINEKIVNNIKNYSKNKNVALVSFKLTDNLNTAEISRKVREIMKESKSDIVVHNDLKTRINGIQKSFNIYQNKNIHKAENAKELSILIEELLFT